MANRHFLAGYVLKITRPENGTPDDIVEDLKGFAKTAGGVRDVESDKRVLEMDKLTVVHGKVVKAIVRTGHYGTTNPIVDRRDGTPCFDRKEYHADLIPLNLVIDFSIKAPGPIAVFYKRGTLGARTSFQQVFNSYLATANRPYRIELVPIGPSKAISTWLKSGRLATIKLHRREQSNSHVGKLQVLQAAMQPSSVKGKRKDNPQPIVEKSLVIGVSWGYMKISDQLKQLIGSENPDASAIAELVGEGGFRPSEVDVTFDTSDRQRTFRVGTEFRVTENITETVNACKTAPEVEAAIYKEAFAYIRELAQLP